MVQDAHDPALVAEIKTVPSKSICKLLKCYGTVIAKWDPQMYESDVVGSDTIAPLAWKPAVLDRVRSMRAAISAKKAEKQRVNDNKRRTFTNLSLVLFITVFAVCCCIRALSNQRVSVLRSVSYLFDSGTFKQLAIVATAKAPSQNEAIFHRKLPPAHRFGVKQHASKMFGTYYRFTTAKLVVGLGALVSLFFSTTTLLTLNVSNPKRVDQRTSRVK